MIGATMDHEPLCDDWVYGDFPGRQTCVCKLVRRVRVATLREAVDEVLAYADGRAPASAELLRRAAIRINAIGRPQ